MSRIEMERMNVNFDAESWWFFCYLFFSSPITSMKSEDICSKFFVSLLVCMTNMKKITHHIIMESLSIQFVLVTHNLYWSWCKSWNLLTSPHARMILLFNKYSSATERTFNKKRWTVKRKKQKKIDCVLWKRITNAKSKNQQRINKSKLGTLCITFSWDSES